MEEKNRNTQKNNNDNIPKNPNGNKKSSFSLWWIYALIFIPLITLYLVNDSSSAKEIGWTEFQQMVRDDVFDEMVVFNKKNVLEATVKKDKYQEVFKQDASKAEELGLAVLDEQAFLALTKGDIRKTKDKMLKYLSIHDSIFLPKKNISDATT